MFNRYENEMVLFVIVVLFYFTFKIKFDSTGRHVFIIILYILNILDENIG